MNGDRPSLLHAVYLTHVNVFLPRTGLPSSKRRKNQFRNRRRFAYGTVFVALLNWLINISQYLHERSTKVCEKQQWARTSPCEKDFFKMTLTLQVSSVFKIESEFRDDAIYCYWNEGKTAKCEQENHFTFPIGADDGGRWTFDRNSRFAAPCVLFAFYFSLHAALATLQFLISFFFLIHLNYISLVLLRDVMRYSTWSWWIRDCCD